MTDKKPFDTPASYLGAGKKKTDPAEVQQHAGAGEPFFSVDKAKKANFSLLPGWGKESCKADLRLFEPHKAAKESHQSSAGEIVEAVKKEYEKRLWCQRQKFDIYATRMAEQNFSIAKEKGEEIQRLESEIADLKKQLAKYESAHDTRKIYKRIYLSIFLGCVLGVASATAIFLSMVWGG